MSHECRNCGQQCYCDGEDHDQEAPEDCWHLCDDDLGDDEYACGFSFARLSFSAPGIIHDVAQMALPL